MRQKNILHWTLYTALAAGAFWLGIRFLLPWAAPFLLALLTARLMEPGVRYLVKRFRFRRSFAAVACSFLALVLIALLLSLILSQLVRGLSTFAHNLPDLAGQVSNTLTRLEASLYYFVIAAPVETQDVIRSATDSFAAMLEELPSQISTNLLGLAANAATAFPRIFLFVLTYVISVLFISISYPQVTAFLMRQIPERLHERVQALGQDVVATLGKWGRAQLKLIGVTFILLTVSFLFLRIPYGIPLAALISVIDALPVFGTGTVLIPWALLSLLSGDFALGAGLAVTYGMVSITHSFMEPRFIGQQLGLHPVATLMAMYLGFRLIGVLGMITFPMLFILLKQFHDQGHIRLWR